MFLLIQTLCLSSELMIVEFFSGYTLSDLMTISDIYAGLDLSNCSFEEVVEEKWVDPVSHKEYMTWKKSPTLKKDSSKFLQRLFQEDLVPCLTFPNERLTLKVRKAVEDNSLCISPIKVPKSNGTSASDNERCVKI